MTRKTFKTNIGTVELGSIDILEDSLEVFCDIDVVSEDLQELINQKIEEAKEYEEKRLSDIWELKNKCWCQSGVTITGKSIRLIVNDKKEIETVLFVFFDDKEDDHIWASASIDIDLTAYSTELKQMLIKAIAKKFL